MLVNYTLYPILDAGLMPYEQMADFARALLKAGVTILQLRDKSENIRQFLQAAEALSALKTDYEFKLIINDRVDIALACNADGVHLGQSDIPPEYARKLLGKHALIGLSIKSDQELKNSKLDHVDYVGCGAVFSSQTKHSKTTLNGADGLKHLVNLIKTIRDDIPIVAISGITEKNCYEVLQTGVDGVAVASNLVQADNPEKRAAYFLNCKSS